MMMMLIKIALIFFDGDENELLFRMMTMYDDDVVAAAIDASDADA